MSFLEEKKKELESTLNKIGSILNSEKIKKPTEREKEVVKEMMNTVGRLSKNGNTESIIKYLNKVKENERKNHSK